MEIIMILKKLWQEYIAYIICFSLCLTSPVSSQSSQHRQSIQESQNIQQNQGHEISDDEFSEASVESNLDSYLESIKLQLEISSTDLLKRVSDLDQNATRHYQAACCAGMPGIKDHTSSDSLYFITQQYQSIKADVEDYLNKAFSKEDLAEYLIYNSGWLNAVSFDDIYNHLTGYLNDQKFVLIAMVLTIAQKIILAQMYLGQTFNEVDFSPFSLFISDAGLEGITNLTDTEDEISGILLIQPDRQQNGTYIKLDPLSFADAQLVIETSQNSDASLVQLIFYPILENYYTSILEIQTLRGIANPAPPNIQPLIQAGYFSLSAQEIIWEKTHKRLTETSFRNALLEAFNEVIGLDVEQITQAINSTQFNRINQIEDLLYEHINTNWLHQRILTDNDPDYFLTDILETIPYKLQMKGAGLPYFLLEEFQLLPQFIAVFTRTWPTDLYCATLNDCTNNGFKRQLAEIFASSKWAIILNRINQANIDTHLTADEMNAMEDVFDILDSAKISLMENLQRSNLLDQWIEKTLEIASYQRAFQAAHSQYVDTLIQNSHNILSSENIYVKALYQTIKEQKDFQISQETDSLISSIIKASYLDTRIAFNSLLEERLHSFTNETPDNIYYDPQLKSVIDPHKVRSALKDPVSTIQSPLLQAVHQQTLNSERSIIEELLVVGQDMGFFNESFTLKKLSGPEAISSLKNDIFLRLQDPQNSFWCFFFSCQSHIDWYFSKYKAYQKSEILNQNRILSDRYSPKKEVPLFEVITENCPLEMSVTHQGQCRDKISPIVLEALKKQEEDIKDNFQIFIEDIVRDPSDALEKALRVLQPVNNDTLNVNEVNLNYVSLLLQTDNRYKAQFDFHTERLQSHITPTFWQRHVSHIDKAANNLMQSFWFVLLPWISKPIGWLAGRAGFYGIRQNAMQIFPIFNSKAASAYWQALMPVWMYSIYQNSKHNSQAQSQADLTEELYYMNPTTNALVDNTQLIISEHLESFSTNNPIIIPAIVIFSLIVSRFLGPGFRNLHTRYNNRVIRSLKEKHLPKLRQHPNQFDWNMARLREEVRSLQQGSSFSERSQINKSWRAIQRFYNYHRNDFVAKHQINQRMPNTAAHEATRRYLDRWLRQIQGKRQISYRDSDQQMMKNLNDRLKSEI